MISKRKKNQHRLLFVILIFQILAFFNTSTAQDDFTIEPSVHIGGYPGCAAVQGNYVYINQGVVLTVFDISGADIQKVGDLLLREEPSRIVVAGDYVYLLASGSDSSLQIVDISDPQNPEMVCSVALKNERGGNFHVAGNYLYVAQQGSLKVVDVSEPASAAVVASLIVSAKDVFISNSKAYVVGSDGLRIFNVTNPGNPEELGFCSTGSLNGIFIQNDTAYLAGYNAESPWQSGMLIVDVADSTNPKQVGFFPTMFESKNMVADLIEVVENTAYIGAGIMLFIADISTPSNPTELGTFELTEGAFPGIESLQVVTPYAYMATGCSSVGFIMLNVSDPANPQIENGVEEPWDVLHLCSDGDRLYVASWERLWVYGCGDPDNPTLLSSDTTWTRLCRVFVSGNYLYGLKANRMHIIDVADPGNMFEVGVYTSGNGNFRDVKIKGNYAYLLAIDELLSVLEIVNISDFSNPVMEGKFTLPGEGMDLFIYGDSTFACVAYYADSTNQGLLTVDVSTPSAPGELGAAQTQGKPMCIWVADTLAFLGSNLITPDDSTWYIESFSIADATAPTPIAVASGPGWICDLEVYDDLLLASIPTGSMYVFNRMLLQFLAKCHSPASLYFAMVISAMHNVFSIYTMDGWFCFKRLAASASWGLFGQKLTVKPKATKVKVVPPDTTIEKGKKVKFKLTAYDSAGNKIDSKTTWKASGGEIDSESGEFTATEEGDFTVVGTDNISNISGSATVHVTATGVEFRNNIVTDFSLSQNFPNPFNPVTAIEYSVKEKCSVLLQVYDICGRELSTLVDQQHAPGVYKVKFDATKLASGIYFYRIRMKDFQAVKKMVLLE